MVARPMVLVLTLQIMIDRNRSKQKVGNLTKPQVSNVRPGQARPSISHSTSPVRM